MVISTCQEFIGNSFARETIFHGVSALLHKMHLKSINWILCYTKNQNILLLKMVNVDC